MFLEYAMLQQHFQLSSDCDTQTNFDSFYDYVFGLLNQFYPEREITVTSTDPHYVTPAVKAMLRRKNRLMHVGRTDEAGALAARIRTVITRSSTRWMRDVNTRKNAKGAWTKVREVLRGAGNDNSHQVDGLTAEVLNKHYADISTDCDYRAPRSKHTVVGQISSITEMDTFQILNTLRPTATGLGGIPAWFLRIGAPVFAVPLAQLFNQSVVEGALPSQWRTAVITPIPKVPKPKTSSTLMTVR